MTKYDNPRHNSICIIRRKIQIKLNALGILLQNANIDFRE